MKKNNFLLISALLLITTLKTFGQKEMPTLPIDSLTNRITYSEIVYVDSSATKQELYTKAREWFAKTYNSAINVIQMDDKESGKIVGKALMQVYHKSFGTNFPSGHINYTISIYTKDGRYKYEITNFYHTGQLVDGGKLPDCGVCEDMINTKDRSMGIQNQKTYNYYLFQMDNSIKEIVSTLKNAMKTNTINAEKDDW